MQSILPLVMLLQGGGMNPGDQDSMASMLPMLLMMMDETEVDDDGEVVSVHVRHRRSIKTLMLTFSD